MKRTLMWFPEGPMITFERNFDGEFFTCEDLNPEAKIRFRLWPHQLVILGFKCIWAGLMP